MTKLNFELFFPHLRPWVTNLVNVWPAYIVKPQYANWEVFHILSLTLLGGTAILMNLRLIGRGITGAPPSEVYRSLRRWQDVGVIGIIFTGVLMGMANAEKLYDSQAFVVKMCALLGGIILTYGATRPVAREDGAVPGSAKLWLIVGGLIWLAGLAIFATGVLINVGMYHVITAAALVVLIAARGRLRWIFLAGLVLIFALQQVITHVVITDPFDLKHLDPTNKAFTWAYVVWIGGTALTQAYVAARNKATPGLIALIAWAGILVWVTGAAAGRWIAYE